jgi:hypothetical protein
MKTPSSRPGRLLLGLALILWFPACDMNPDAGESPRRVFDFGFEFEFVERERTGLWEHTERTALLRIVPDGIFSLLMEDEEGQLQLSLGKVTEIDGEIRFIYDASLPGCVGVIGKYDMDLESNQDGPERYLHLEVREDACESRSTVLSGTWIKREGSRRTSRDAGSTTREDEDREDLSQ